MNKIKSNENAESALLNTPTRISRACIAAGAAMSEERDSGGGEEVRPACENAVPMQMQLFSAWEARKVPAYCVSRCDGLCVRFVGLFMRALFRNLSLHPT